MMLDTDVLIALEKRTPESQVWFSGLVEMPSVSGFAAMELLAGCQNAADRQRIERNLRPFAILWPDEAALNRAVLDFGALRLRFGLGVLDMLIAATALYHGQDLATFNAGHFTGVPGLITLLPYKR